MTVTALVFAALPLFGLVFAAPTSRDDAGSVPREPNFDATRYVGKWYEIARTKNMPFEFGTDNQANYALNTDGTVAVQNLEWRSTKWSEASAVATVVDNARLSVDFSLGPPGDYQVVETDYDTYAIVYSYGGKFGPIKVQFGWILARQTTLPQDVIDHAFEKFDEIAGMKQSLFHMTEHGVATIPPPNSATPQMRGSSNGHVPLQPDFNLAAYLGLWYEMYRTSNMFFESGTDVTAFYESKHDGTVSVTNKEWIVVDKQWNMIQGVAVYLSNAHLSVQFESTPPGDYRVLYTDYVNIAVVYSEAQYPVGYKYGWVLSRVPSLTAEQEAKAFQVFKEAAGMDRSLFQSTPHGVADHSKKH